MSWSSPTRVTNHWVLSWIRTHRSCMLSKSHNALNPRPWYSVETLPLLCTFIQRLATCILHKYTLLLNSFYSFAYIFTGTSGCFYSTTASRVWCVNGVRALRYIVCLCSTTRCVLCAFHGWCSTASGVLCALYGCCSMASGVLCALYG